jgi:hypothetical protein
MNQAQVLWPLDMRLDDDFIFDRDAARPWLLTIWEPLRTKAPGPHLSRAYCCYINTVIFYCRPAIVRRHSHLWRDGLGRWKASAPGGGYEEWDHIDTALTWDVKLHYNGDDFIVGGGTVMWTNEPDHGRRRWWMKRNARREWKEPA